MTNQPKWVQIPYGANPNRWCNDVELEITDCLGQPDTAEVVKMMKNVRDGDVHTCPEAGDCWDCQDILEGVTMV